MGTSWKRKQLSGAAWPDAFVEEGNLPVNISLLRKVLGDGQQDGNRYIETVPRRGYRFIAPVTQIGPPVSNLATGDRPAIPPAETGVVPAYGSNGMALQDVGGLNSPLEQTWGVRRWLWLAGLAFATGAIAAAGYVLVRPLPPPSVYDSRQLTNDGLAKWRLATDGLRLYFTEAAAGHPFLKESSVNGGDVAEVPGATQGLEVSDISPNGSSLLLSGAGGAETPSGSFRCREDHFVVWEVWKGETQVGRRTGAGSRTAETTSSGWQIRTEAPGP